MTWWTDWNASEFLILINWFEGDTIWILFTQNTICTGIAYKFTTLTDICRIDCNKAEDGIKTTPCSQCALNALAIDEPLEYTKLYLDGTMQIWVDAEDSIEL